FFYHTVDLRRAQANTVAVDGGVRTTIDDRCASLGKQNPVAMAPFSGVLLEIAVQVALVILVAPEEQRHGRHWFGIVQFANFVDKRLALLVDSVWLFDQIPLLAISQLRQ